MSFLQNNSKLFLYKEVAPSRTKAMKYSRTFQGSRDKDPTRHLYFRWPPAGAHSLEKVPGHSESQTVTVWSQIPFFKSVYDREVPKLSWLMAPLVP